MPSKIKDFTLRQYNAQKHSIFVFYFYSMNITCPSCQHEFSLNDVLNNESTQILKQQLIAESEATLAKEKNELNTKWQKLQQEKDAEMEAKLKSISKDYENKNALAAQKLAADMEAKMKFLEEQNTIASAKLQKSQEIEIALHKANEQLASIESNKKLELEKTKLEAEKEAREKFEKETLPAHLEQMQMKLKEKDLQMEGYKKNIEELKQKSEQGSMQAQGEVQELILEEFLTQKFIYDEILEVGKGVRGADCIQVVKNNYGEEVGRIIYESKRTKDWNNEWIEKIKTDARNAKIDTCIIVSQILPKEIKGFGYKDGVWVCTMSLIEPLVMAMRTSILKISDAKASQENKGDKMVMLYDYLTSTEFAQYLEAIVEGFSTMKDGIMKEKMMMEKIWKEREKQLEKTLINASRMYGGIKGIAGNSVASIGMLELPSQSDD
jgi:hypothetical protein